MRKLLVFMLAALFMFSLTATGFAATFADVPAKHWAYEAVEKLAKANLIEGYGDGTFRGDKPMSRYEIAFMTARAIERYDLANTQQKAAIDKLSAEFAAELNKMGLRVAKLESKTNTWVSGGDMRFRYHWNNPQTPGGSRLHGPINSTGGDELDLQVRLTRSGLQMRELPLLGVTELVILTVTQVHLQVLTSSTCKQRMFLVLTLSRLVVIGTCLETV